MRVFFLPLGKGRNFCALHLPKRDAQVRGAVVYIPPFAEEMNKSRRMAALQSRALSDAGWHVLQFDLFGSGDSEGDFGDASWDIWLDDLIAATAWLHKETGCRPLLWGLRSGCLLAAQAATRLAQGPNLVSGFLFWQPVISGRLFLQQFLRVERARLLLGKGAAASGPETGGPGEALEVAGYGLSPGLRLGLDSADLRPPTGPHSRHRRC